MNQITGKCPACGASNPIEEGQTVVRCAYCDTTYSVQAPAPSARSSAGTMPAPAPSKQAHTAIPGRIRLPGGRIIEIPDLRTSITIGCLIFGLLLITVNRLGSLGARLGSWLVVVSAILRFSRSKEEDVPFDGTEKMPWAYTGWGIFLLGLFTGTLWWFAGYLCRRDWLRSHGLLR
ncbi:MAG: hypothetical protein HUJ80_03290 [Firmicutes bacterium]|nr:hypothetical protein [Bacillota bacterium]